jgi:hypothetical protein
MSQQDFFAVESQRRKIHELSGFLPKLAEFVDFEHFVLICPSCAGRVPRAKGEAGVRRCADVQGLCSEVSVQPV